MKLKRPLMVCTQARGGMRSVVEAYERDGLFDRWHFQWLWTHQEGGVLTKLIIGFGAYFKMLSMILRGKVSFIHLHAAMRGSFWRKSFFMKTAQLFGVPCILHLHGSEMKTFYNTLSPFGQALVKRSLESAEMVVVLSDSWRLFVSQAAPKANIAVINNYVSLPKGTAAKISGSNFNVLFLGILGHRKGVYDLLASWVGVLQKLPQAKLLIGGNGEIEKATQVAYELGISHAVNFLGWIDKDKKEALLEDADAFVLPSYNEGLPMSVLEAMAYQVPVVTTNVGGIPELISDDTNGLMIDPGDQEALTKALIKLGEDADYSLSIASAGRSRVEGAFSDKVVLPKLEAVYKEILT